MKHPESSILLAAGRGKRLRPFTDELPKPLLRVGGRSILDYTLSALAQTGIRRVCLVTHHLEHCIHAYVTDGSRWGLEAAYCHQAELLGSADALRTVLIQCPDWIRRDSPVLISATDYILSPNALADLVAAHVDGHFDITISLKHCPPEEIVMRSSVDLTEAFEVRRIVEKPALHEAPSPFTAALIFIMPPAIWEYLSELPISTRGEMELQTILNWMLDDGFTAFGLLQPAPEEWKPERMSSPIE